MPDGDGDELHSSPISLEGRDEGDGVCLGFLRKFVVASEISAKSILYKNEGAQILVHVALYRVGSGLHASGINEIRRNAVALREEPLSLFY